MRVAVFEADGDVRIGLVDLERRTVAPFDIAAEKAAAGVTALFEYADRLPSTLSPLSLDQIKLLAPVPRPRRNVFCVGKNYRDHAREFARSGFDSSAAGEVVPEFPIVFSKVPECVIAHDDPVLIDTEISAAIDYEAELGVIIGRGGKGIARGEAMEHVWGYTIINDVTARDLQARHKQWLLGKSLDTFCPMGPWAVTADEVDLADTKLKCWVNGELRQSANTRDLIFDVPEIIATISRNLRLYPGDVIATGTPAGVGIGFEPPRYLTVGDRVKIEVEGIGSLENTMSLASSRP